MIELERFLKYYLQYASDSATVSPVPNKSNSRRRSGCPVSASLEVFGDRWSLLIIRDMMIRGFHSFKQFAESGEGIATNILSDRLRKLVASGIISAETDESDRRKISYRLTEKGIDLAPVLLELLLWGARHERTAAAGPVMDVMAKNREAILAEVRRRWDERDSTPLQVNGQWQLPLTQPEASAREAQCPATVSRPERSRRASVPQEQIQKGSFDP